MYQNASGVVNRKASNYQIDSAERRKSLDGAGTIADLE